MPTDPPIKPTVSPQTLAAQAAAREQAEPLPETGWILGLDLGSGSVGWARLAVRRKGTAKKPTWQPTAILDAGVRTFEAGVDGSKEQILAGKDAARSTQRRDARQPRRQTWRRRHRKRMLFRELQTLGLLPPSDGIGPLERKQTIDALDDTLRKRHLDGASHQDHQKLPYLMRVQAASKPAGTDEIERYEVGRALYHLGQRRGFQSNRQTDPSDEEAGVVRGAIEELAKAMGNDSLAKHFVDAVRPAAQRRDESDGKQHRPIRRRYLGRDMIRDEFDQIRKTQTHLGLNAAQWDRLAHVMFFQRPLKSQKGKVGVCELETYVDADGRRQGRPRCHKARPIFQRFRILQRVNELRLRVPDGPDRGLDASERATLTEALQTQGDRTFPQARKLLGLPRAARFTLEIEGDSKGEGRKLPGDRTGAKFRAVIGEDWDGLDESRQDELAREVAHYRDAGKLSRRLQSDAWGFDADRADAIAQITLERDYARHSAKALGKLVEAMDDGDGTAYSTARRALYESGFRAGDPVDLLPPVREVAGSLANPAVMRSLTEMRKVVNELVRRHGKPILIRIEFARELKNPRARRVELDKRNGQLFRRRQKAAQAIVAADVGVSDPRRSDIEKWMLAEECDWTCPYTGKPITPRTLYGKNPEFDIEHIFPRRFLDDSRANKTLCLRSSNRNRKRDRLPSECFSDDELERVLQRVRNFKGEPGLVRAKVRRFVATRESLESKDDIFEDFTHRHLNDTRYISRMAADYLGQLYGGRVDAGRRLRVFATTGGLTWMLREAWQLNRLLGDPEDPDAMQAEKQRDDNRHHAIDAVLVALSDAARVKAVAEAASSAENRDSRRFLTATDPPFKGFDDQLVGTLDAMVVSRRPSRTIAGGLHAETIYSPKRAMPTAKGETEEKPAAHRIRRPIENLSPAEIRQQAIVDPRVRACVHAWLAERGVNLEKPTEAQLKKATAAIDPEDVTTYPQLTKETRNAEPQSAKPQSATPQSGEPQSGEPTPIKRVRVVVQKNPRLVGTPLVLRSDADDAADPGRPYTSARHYESGKGTNYASLVYEVPGETDARGQPKKGRKGQPSWEHEIADRLTVHRRLSAARRSGDGRAHGRDALPIDEQDGRRRFLFALVANDTVELDGTAEREGERVLYRVQSLSQNEIQLCPLNWTTVTTDRRDPDNRIRTVETLRKRRCRPVQVSPAGVVASALSE